MNDDGNCTRCKRPLIEIDHYGERLVGCVECNRWSWRGSHRLFMELPEHDLAALRQKSDGKSDLAIPGKRVQFDDEES